MNIQATLCSGDAASAQAAHKAVLNHSHEDKAGTHRYERRKVREYLRRADAEKGVEVIFANETRRGGQEVKARLQ